MNYSNIKLVIFDMDGTLFNTEKLGINLWEKSLSFRNYSIPEHVLYKKNGLNSKDSKKLFIQEFGTSFNYNAVKEKKKKRIYERIY